MARKSVLERNRAWTENNNGAEDARCIVNADRESTIQKKFATTRRELSNSLIERDGEIDVVLTALIAQENPLLVGPPGTAKSLLLDSLLQWMGPSTKRFSILLTKFTTPEEVFGPISVQGLKNDQYRRITVGKLPEADVAFVDEIFKASSAILNTMLRILNERVYENGDGTFKKVPLKLCVSASNEWPSDEGGKELGALFDRFLFRKTVKPIQSEAGRKRLLWNYQPPVFSTSISTREIDEASKIAASLLWHKDAKAALETILRMIRLEGVFPGDRRQFKSVRAAQAYAYLCGSEMVMPEHLEILAHTLWDDPTEQPEKVARIVAKVANPVGMLVNDKLTQVESILTNANGSTASIMEVPQKLKAVQAELGKLNQQDNRVQRAIEYVTECLKDAYTKAVEV
jgi:MoxR-like ATPase